MSDANEDRFIESHSASLAQKSRCCQMCFHRQNGQPASSEKHTKDLIRISANYNRRTNYVTGVVQK